MKIRETIHHGDYYNVREIDIPPTWAGFVDLMTTSPYRGGDTAETLAVNKYAAQTFANLLTLGKGDRGWAHYVRLGSPDE